MRTVEETAEQLRTTVGALYTMRHRGEGPRAVRQGRRLIYAQSEIDAYVARLYAEQAAG
ncbi:helix-turn-helix domain-containing protein [Parafrankia sp. FMc2]|uniref:helix-turn-helix domain-containing protein n=1 Tax=Parafrankia sp. FMc2 TaxID=3233196 RepID=UPI0034D4D571